MSQETARRVLQIEAEAIADLIPRLGETFDRAVELLAGCQGRVVATGMGKSGIVCRKIAATLSSTGTPSVFLHPAEAIHGNTYYRHAVRAPQRHCQRYMTSTIGDEAAGVSRFSKAEVGDFSSQSPHKQRAVAVLCPVPGTFL